MDLNRIKYIGLRVAQSTPSFIFQKMKIELYKIILSKIDFFLSFEINRYFKLISIKSSGDIFFELKGVKSEDLDFIQSRVMNLKKGAYQCLGYGSVNVISGGNFK